MWISGMHRATHCLVFARTHGQPGEAIGITAFFVPKGTPGKSCPHKTSHYPLCRFLAGELEGSQPRELGLTAHVSSQCLKTSVLNSLQVLQLSLMNGLLTCPPTMQVREPRTLSFAGAYSNHSALTFTDVFVSDTAVLGTVGHGLAIAQVFVHENRLRQAASSLGAAEYCIEQSIKYAKKRKPFGKELSTNQAIQFPIVELATQVSRDH